MTIDPTTSIACSHSLHGRPSNSHIFLHWQLSLTFLLRDCMQSSIQYHCHNSVCPSVCQMRVLWQNEIISVNISTPYEKGTSLVCRFHGGCWEFACFRNKNLSGTTYLAELYTQSGVDEITDCCVIRAHVGCRWIVMIVRWCSFTRINNSSGGITN